MEKLPIEFKEKWVKALRSGRYKQGKDTLYSRGKYCCLGVACRVGGLPAGKIKSCYIELPSEQAAVPEILHCVSGPIRSVDTWRILAQMNDGGKSFAEIADYIEQNL
jgi:hypothetical protein